MHRLIYTDPAIFDSRDDAHLRRHLGLSGARKPDSERQRFHHAASWACVRSSSRATPKAKSARCTIAAPIAAPRLCRWDKGNTQIVPVPLSRLEFSQHGQAARRALAGRLRRRSARSEVQSRPGAARRIVSRLHLRHAQSRMRRRSPSISGRSRSRSTNGSIAIPAARSWSARPTGSDTRATGSSPTTIQATAITSSIRIARCWKPRIASPARTPRAWPITATRPTTQPMYMRYTGHGNHFKDKRPNLEKRPGGLWAIESAHPGMEHVRGRVHRALRRPRLSRCSTLPAPSR